jgi:hypothetical protein
MFTVDQTGNLQRPRASSSSLALFLFACAAMILLWLVGDALAPVNPPAPTHAFDSILLPNNEIVAPEPRDMFLYVATLLFIPLALFATAALTKTFTVAAANPAPIFWSTALAAFAIVATHGGLAQLERFLGGWLLIVTVICVAAAGVLVTLKPARIKKLFPWTFWGLFLVTCALVLLQRVWTESSLIYYGHVVSHYEAVTSSVVRIATGGTCLADVVPQYGCYGEFLAPILKILGRDVTTVTTLFSMLLLTAIASALRFSTILIKDRLLALGCGLCLVIAAALNSVYDVVDPVLQYFPLRFLFPAISLLMAAWFQNAPSMRRAIVLGLFGGAAIAWNLESGLAVLISLAAFATVGNFTERPWLRRAGWSQALVNAVAYVTGVVVFVSVFVTYLFVKSDSPVDLTNYFIYQKVFALTGFGMIPMPAPPAPWTAHALLIFAVLVLCTLSTCTNDRRDKGIELAAFVAVLSIGLFVYYVGRSHPLVLRLVVWPSGLLFFFLLDRTVASSNSRMTRICSTLGTVIALALPAAFLVSAMPGVAHIVEVARNAPPQDNAAVLDDIAYIKARTEPGERIAIVALDQGVLWGHTKTRAALEGPGVAEMIRRVDLDHQIEGLVKRGPQKLFVGTNLALAARNSVLGTNILVDMEELKKAYALVETAPGGRLIYLRRRS